MAGCGVTRPTGQRTGPTIEERERIKALERENRDCARPMIFCIWPVRILPRRRSTAAPSPEAFVDQYRDRLGDESIAVTCSAPRPVTADMRPKCVIRHCVVAVLSAMRR